MIRPMIKIACYITALALFACGGKSNDVRDAARESLGGNTEATATTPSSPTAPTMAASAPAGSVQHYICPKGCAGSGGGAAGTCPVCGSEYLHNQAYHNQTQTQAPAGDQSIQKVTFPGSTTTSPAPTTPPTPEPAQNAAGIWHYTCAKGCTGGAGSPGTCATCGGALAHNTAYHQ